MRVTILLFLLYLVTFAFILISIQNFKEEKIQNQKVNQLSLNVSFSTPFIGLANLELYNLDGKKVRGTKEILFSGGHKFRVFKMKVGIYYFRFKIGAFSEVKKVVQIKKYLD